MALISGFFLYPLAIDLVAVLVVCKGTLIVMAYGLLEVLNAVCLVQDQCFICAIQLKRVY